MLVEPHIIIGNSFSDDRGKIFFNNEFNAVEVKRIYFITNHSLNFVRGWQGHQIEQRWFMCVKGVFEIKIIKVDNWDKPSRDLQVLVYHVNSDNADVLYVPKGYISSIQALEESSKLMAMSDYQLGEVNDEYRFDSQYFK